MDGRTDGRRKEFGQQRGGKRGMKGGQKLKLPLGCVDDEKYEACEQQSVRPPCKEQHLQETTGDWTLQAEEAVLAATDLKFSMLVELHDNTDST